MGLNLLLQKYGFPHPPARQPCQHPLAMNPIFNMHDTGKSFK